VPAVPGVSNAGLAGRRCVAIWVQHGLDVAQYRVRWELSLDHAVMAPTYWARRFSNGEGKSGSAASGPRSWHRRWQNHGNARGGSADQRRVRSARDIGRLWGAVRSVVGIEGGVVSGC